MNMSNIPDLKCGIISVSRDCFIISLSENRRQAIVSAYEKKYGNLYEVKKTVENERDMLAAVKEAKDAGCNALVVFLGNFGPETPETLIAREFDGPVMYVAAAEETGKNLINGRGDAYCGMLNCSYNLGLRHLKAFIPEYPVGTAEELADMIAEFQPGRPHAARPQGPQDHHIRPAPAGLLRLQRPDPAALRPRRRD